MKKKINLTLDDEIIAAAKKYAKKKNVSLSQIVENGLKQLPLELKRKKNQEVTLKDLHKKFKIDKLTVSDKAVEKALNSREKKYL